MQGSSSFFYVAVDDSFVRAGLAGLLVILALVGLWCLRQQAN